MSLNRDQIRHALELWSGGVWQAWETVTDVARMVADAPTRWICLVDDEFSCNGYLADDIAVPEQHHMCGEFALVKLRGSPILPADDI
jgi:hypothetical protein